MALNVCPTVTVRSGVPSDAERPRHAATWQITHEALVALEKTKTWEDWAEGGHGFTAFDLFGPGGRLRYWGTTWATAAEMKSALCTNMGGGVPIDIINELVRASAKADTDDLLERIPTKREGLKMGRDLEQERRRLDELVGRRGGRVYVDVPVASPELGWPPDTISHRVDAVWFDTGTPGEIVDPASDRAAAFTKDLERDAVLVSARGYSDRTAFGMLVACRELLSRSYPEHGTLRCLALTDEPRWMDAPYLAAGITLEYPEGVAPWPTKRRSGGPIEQRARPSGEDLLLRRYYDEVYDAAGTLWQEVPVSTARLDGLGVPSLPGAFEWWPGKKTIDLATVIRDNDVEVIEAKSMMNTDVIGQTIAGASLLTHEYPRHRLVSQTAVVGGTPDHALDWVCRKLGIQVARLS